MAQKKTEAERRATRAEARARTNFRERLESLLQKYAKAKDWDMVRVLSITIVMLDAKGEL